MPQFKTEGQHKGEFLVGDDVDSISFEAGVLATGHVVKDGTPLAKSGANVVPLVGTGASDGTLDETFVGLSFGDYDSTDGPVKIAYVARLTEVDSRLLHYPVSATNQAAVNGALDSALAAKFIVKR